MNMNPDYASNFKSVIEDIVKSEIKKSGITNYISAIVHHINQDGSVNVYLPPNRENIVTGLYNKTGEELKNGDSVEIATKNGSLSNAWIAVKHGITIIDKNKHSDSGGGGSSIQIYETAPVGSVIMYAGTDLPSGWMICDGSAISRQSYVTLFNKIGTIYGAGDGSTTFNIPNFQGRIGVGKDSTQTEFDTLGETGGSKYLQQHNHMQSLYNAGTRQGVASYDWQISNEGRWYDGSDLAGNVANSWQTGNSGNLQPYIVTQYIIKVINVKQSLQTVDSLPIGSILYYDGDTIPEGYQQIEDYSTTEIYTGKKYNGKKVYTITFDGVFTDQQVILTNVQKVLLFTGSGDPGTGVTRVLPYYEIYNNNKFELSIGQTGDSVIVRSSLNGTPSNCNMVITIEYTKTTD